MIEQLLPEYDQGNIRRGMASLAGGQIRSRLFTAGTVIEEGDFEIQVPALAGPVLIMAPIARARVSYQFDGPKREVNFHKGFVSIMPTGLAPWFESLGCGGPMAHIHFAADALARVFEDEPVGLRPRPPERDDIARALAEMLFAIGPAASSLQIEGVGIAILSHLARRDQNRRDRRLPTTGHLAPWQLIRAEELLRADLAGNASLGDLAAEAKLSPFHFARCFKATTGEPPHRFLIRLRIERAREMLETSDVPIGQIAAAVGYDDPAYFARLFRQEVGFTPSQYRRERRQ